MNSSSDTRPRLIFGLPESLVDFLIPVALNVIFIVIVALLLWPMGKLAVAVRLMKAYVIFWGITVFSVVVLYQVQRMLRVSAERNFAAFLISNLLLGLTLLAGWSAFSSGVVNEAVADAGVGVTIVLWVVGLVSGIAAHVVVTTFHNGTIYTLSNLIVVVVGFVVFGVWPAVARVTYGRFFNLFP